MFGKNIQLSAVSILLVLIITLLIPFSAQADTHTWTGNYGNSWSYNRNWSPSSVPGAMDNVLIEDGNNLPVYYNAPAVPLAGLTIDHQGSLGLSGDYTLLAMNEYIGYDGEGFFTQNGGSNQAMGALYLGYQSKVTESWAIEYFNGFWTQVECYETPGGNGTYTLNGGTLTTTGDVIGVNGTGVFTQNGGIHTVAGNIVLGQEGESFSSRYAPIYDGADTALVTTTTSASSGTYILNGGTTQTHTISDGDGAGKLIINGGTLSVVSGNISVDNLILGDSSGSDGSYAQNMGAVTVYNETVGNNGKGTYFQTGGTHTAANLTIGSNGTYELSGNGVLNTTSGLELNGTFNQLGGTHTAYEMNLYTDDSIYNMAGGSLNTSGLQIDAGTFSQDGGTHTSTCMDLGGSWEEREGSYNLTDGVLRVTGSEIIGYNKDSTGVFYQSGGTHTAGHLQIGYGFSNSGVGIGAGEGIYTLTAGDLTVGSLAVAVYGAGTFIQEGGAVVVENDLTFGTSELGVFLFGEGTYNLNGGTLQVDTISSIGHGTLSINGGSLTVDTGNITLDEFYLGETAGRSGSYTQSIGTITAETETIGKYGTGDFTQTGGTHTVKDVLSLGRRAGSDGTYTLNDGDLTVDNRELVGFYGTGTFNQTGGTHTVENTLFLGYGASGQGTYTLDGGDLTAGQEHIGHNGSGTFTQNSGTNTVTGDLNIGTQGRYTQAGGTLDTGGIKNSGQFTSSGGTLTVGTSGIQNTGDMNLGSSNNQIGGSVSNSGTLEIAGSTAFTGDITNTGTFRADNTTITLAGTYTENAVFASNASASTIDNLVINSTGYLKGGLADEWIIYQTFENLSLKNLEWDTGDATLTFSGNTGHELYLAGADFGADMAGYLNNFAWGCLNIEGSLTLFDGNSEAGGALYVNTLTGLDILDGIIMNILLDESETDLFNIYYLADLADNAYLGGLTYDLAGGGSLIGISNSAAVPVPGSLFLLLSGMLVLLKIKRGRVCNRK